MTVPAPEFSRSIAIDSIPRAGTVVEIAADAAERAALAKRFGILGIDALSATVRLKPIAASPMVRVTAALKAEVVQACVVTLDPVAQHVEESFELVFGPGLAEEEEAGALVLKPDAEDPPEPIVDGAIDVGEAVAEHLALALDPFPRIPGASFEGREYGGQADEEAPTNAFAALARLKGRPGRG